MQERASSRGRRAVLRRVGWDVLPQPSGIDTFYTAQSADAYSVSRGAKWKGVGDHGTFGGLSALVKSLKNERTSEA